MKNRCDFFIKIYVIRISDKQTGVISSENITEGERVFVCEGTVWPCIFHSLISSYGILTLLASASEDLTPEVAQYYNRIKFTQIRNVIKVVTNMSVLKLNKSKILTLSEVRIWEGTFSTHIYYEHFGSNTSDTVSQCIVFI